MGENTASVSSALIITNHLFRWAGSELVAIEFAEELVSRGIRVELFVTSADPGFIKDIFGDRVRLHASEHTVDLQTIDLVYAQHHVFPLLLNLALDGDKVNRFPFLVWNHLSPFEPLELPGPFVEKHLADVILSNSLETQSKLAEFGVPFTDARLWPNPAPRAFGRYPASDRVEVDLLAVSNHHTRELLDAFRLLEERGVRVRLIGEIGAKERVTPEKIASAASVVTIGKTVQYALRARRPVYCYGPHGGAGWLSTTNFGASRKANFSGRSHPAKKSAEQIAEELLAGAQAATEFAAGLNLPSLDFCLELLVDDLLEQARVTRADPVWQRHRLQFLSKAETKQAIALESNLCAGVRKFYLKANRALDKQAKKDSGNPERS